MLGASIDNHEKDGAEMGTGRKHMVQFGNELIFLSVGCHRKIVQNNIVLSVSFVVSRRRI
jgi:hypothetical protein